MNDLISREAAIEALAEAYEDTDAEYILRKIPSAQQWIPVSERLPEELEQVNITWINRDPEPYYSYIKDKPFTATGIFFRERWYWDSATCKDYLVEYGRSELDEVSEAIEIVAWMPLPSPYEGGV